MKPTWRSSVLDRRFSCPGSATLEPLVDEPIREEGDEGTFIHHAIADRLIREHGAVAPDDLQPPKVAKGYKLPKNSEWMIDWCVRHVISRVPKNWTLMVEVELEYEFDQWINRGHLDYLALSPDGTQAIGGDYKTGRDPKDPAENNWQVFSYQTLAKLNWDSLARIEFDLIQPRLTEDDEFERVSTSALEGDRLEGAADSLDLFAREALSKPMELQSGPKQCRWCPLMFTLQCPALKQDRDMAKLTMTQEAVAAINRQPNDDQLVEWVSVMRTLKPAAEAAEEALHSRLDQTECVVGAGMTVTRKIQRGSYSVEDEAAFNSALRAVVTDIDPLLRCYKPSMTRVKDVIAEVLQVPKSGAGAITAQSVFDAHLRPLVVQGERRLLQFST